MNFTAIRALVRNDLRVYLSDRRGLIVGVLVPILIAAFFGYVFGGNGSVEEAGKIPIAVVDEDYSAVSRGIAADLAQESMVTVQNLTQSQAEEQVRLGKMQVAVIMPKGFGSGATRALFSGEMRPQVQLLIDPSQAMSGRVVEGLFAQHGMQEITKEAFTGAMGQATLADSIRRLDRATTAEVPERAELKALLEAARSLNSRIASEGGTADLRFAARTQHSLYRRHDQSHFRAKRSLQRLCAFVCRYDDSVHSVRRYRRWSAAASDA